MKKSFLLFGMFAFLYSCNYNETFTANGTIAGGEGRVLYLEASEMNKIRPIDSVTIGKDGKFKFKSSRPENPEFYRLRIDSSFINFSVDSTETITFKTQYSSFSSGYQVEGSDNCEKIRLISLASNRLKTTLDSTTLLLQANKLDKTEGALQLMNAIANYKEYVRKFIFENPKSAAAYFGLFQRINGQTVFDPNERNDRKAICAVATSFDNFYPKSNRTKQLHDMAIMAIKENRDSERQSRLMDNASVASYIEIELPDVSGKKHKLSSLTGKVILLDFTAYQTDYSPEYNIALSELYRKYSNQGFEIYQVSLDREENPWKVAASNLPWLCVRDASSTNSPYARLYNVQKLPTCFLLDRNCAIVKRITSIGSLGAEIERLL